MKKETYEMVKQILTTHPIWSNDTDYSLSLVHVSFEDFEYRRINVFSNSPKGSFHDGYAMFFCQVAEICNCHCSFRSVNDVCVCSFY